MTMIYLSPPVLAQAAKKIQVKIKPEKLEGLNEVITEKEKIVRIALKWKRPKPSLTLPLIHRSSSKQTKCYSCKRYVKKGVEFIEWNDDEFENVYDPLDRFDVMLSVLYGESNVEDKKLEVLGTILLTIPELAAITTKPRIKKKLPITLKMAGVAIEATLSVSISFMEIRNFQESMGIVQNSTESSKDEGFLRWVTGYMPSIDIKKKKKTTADKVSSRDSDESFSFDSVSGTEMGSLTSLETRVESTRKVRFWKRRRLSFRTVKPKEEPKTIHDLDMRRKGEPLIGKTSDDDEAYVTDIDHQLTTSSSVDSITSTSRQKIDEETETSSALDNKEETLITRIWESKEILSRDGLTKLNANLFFASFDQCSQEAAGESACTALSAIIAHWFQSNPNVMPTRSEFDSLITEGSSEWRKLCEKPNSNCFQDKHFDLETVLEAEIRPIHVVPEKSFICFFDPEKFESLNGAMSFDEIWRELSSKIVGDEGEPRIYIVSWNDHFFVLKVEADACYIIDTLGERLFEGCNKAYILKFDDSTLMHGKAEKQGHDSEEMDNAEKTTNHNNAEETEEVICSGKECCREFIKRYLAAISVNELEEEAKKGSVSNISLLQRLQIEFQYISTSSARLSASSLLK